MGHRSVLAINDGGPHLVQDDAGAWLIQGSADGLIYAAEDRLAWLLPLLERTPSDVRAALPQMPLADTPLPALVRFALTAWGEYWPGRALAWLEAGWSARDRERRGWTMRKNCIWCLSLWGYPSGRDCPFWPTRAPPGSPGRACKPPPG